LLTFPPLEIDFACWKVDHQRRHFFHASGRLRPGWDVHGEDSLIWQVSFNVDDGGDTDGNGDTDGDDFLTWQAQFGLGSGAASAAVPEPTSIALVIAVAVAGLFSRRRWLL
jgi:hypothetical protein